MNSNQHYFGSLGSYLSNDIPCFTICQEMCLSDEVEIFRESIKSTKKTPLIIRISIRVEILLIPLGPLNWVLINGIWPKWYQMKAKDLFFDMISKFYQKFHIYYRRIGGKKCFTTYLCTKVDHNIVSFCRSKLLLFSLSENTSLRGGKCHFIFLLITLGG